MSVNPIKGKFVKLQNDEALRASNAAADGEVAILKVNASDEVELISLPVFDDGDDVSQLATEKYVDGEIATVDGRIDNHVDGSAEKHNADHIVVEAGISGLDATDVQAALSEISGDAAAAQGDIDTHVNATVGAHAASAISFSNTASELVAITVQAAIDEVEGRVDLLEVGGGDTKEIKISEFDTTPGYATEKIVGASGKISVSIVNPGADEDLQITIGNDVFDKTVDGASNVTYSNINGELVATNVQAAIDELSTRDASDWDYSNINGELVATNVQAAIDELSTRDASDWDYSNINGELVATNVQAAIDELSTRDASDWSYDNATSLLTATDIQAAIDELSSEKVDSAGDSMTGFLTLHADPSSDYHAATKKYVDAVAEGLHVHKPVRLLADFDLDGSYNNGTAGVGAYLDYSLSPIAGIDGISSFNVGDRIIVAFQNGSSLDPENGIYYIKESADINGSGDIVKLTRALDFDTPAEMAGGDFVFIQEGTQYADSGWVMTETVVTVGTTPVQFLQFSGAGAYAAGDALSLTGNEFDVKFDGSSINLDGFNRLQVKLLGISTGMLQNDSVTSDKIADFAVTQAQIDSSVAGDAMEKDLVDGKLNVKYDDSSIGLNSPEGQLEVKLLGISTGMLQNDSVTSDKIADFAVTQAQIDSSVAGDAMEKDLVDGKLNVKYDDSSIGLNSPEGQLEVKLLGISTGMLQGDSVTSDKIADFAVTQAQIDSSVAGDAMEKDLVDGKLNVKYDDSSIGLNSPEGQLEVKLLGISTGMLQNDSVTSDKIADLAVTQAQIDSSVAGDAMEKDLVDGKLNVKYDDSSIGLNSPEGQLEVKLLGISTGMLQGDAVTADKIGADAVTAAKINSDVAGNGLAQNMSTGALEIKPEFSTIADISVSSGGLSIANRWHKQAITLLSGDITNGYVDLGFTAEDKSIVAFVDRLAIHEGAEIGDTLNDYWVEIQGGVTRVHFMNALVALGPQALAANDNLFFTYQKKAS